MPVGNNNTIIAGGGCHHIAIQTRDWDASIKLYRDVLGMPLVMDLSSGDSYVWLMDMGDGSHIELFNPKDNTPAPGSAAPNDPIVHFALATTDTRAAIEVVREAGYRVTVEPKDIDRNGFSITIAFFEGPNGEVIEFFQTR